MLCEGVYLAAFVVFSGQKPVRAICGRFYGFDLIGNTINPGTPCLFLGIFAGERMAARFNAGWGKYRQVERVRVCGHDQYLPF